MYDLSEYKEIRKCPIADIVCCKPRDSWTGFGCWCCLVATQNFISDQQVPWKKGLEYLAMNNQSGGDAT